MQSGRNVSLNQVLLFFHPHVCWSDKHTALVVIPSLLEYQLNLELRAITCEGTFQIAHGLVSWM